MSTAMLLHTLATRGVVVRIDGGDLKLSPARSLDAVILADVRHHKAELLSLLAQSTLESPIDPATEEAAAHDTQLARLAAVFPDAVQLDSGDWHINGATYDNAVLLAAYSSGTTTNGHPDYSLG